MKIWGAFSSVLAVFAFTFPSFAQDDVTTRNASSGYNGAWITGPASNPLSFLNGNAYRTFASQSPYVLPDFRPASLLNEQLPHWISFGVEERFRYEGYHDSGFKRNNNDSYELNRFRLQMNLQFGWFKLVTQTQDARAFLQKPPLGPPNTNRWDLKLAYAELGDPEKSWFSLRVGRQLINYNNTIIADSQWRNQGRSYDAVVTNLHYDRYRLGIFAASVVAPLIDGISHHQEGNNIYGLYGGVDHLFLHDAVLEPFVLWRVQPSVAVEANPAEKTGRQNEKAWGFRYKGVVAKSLDFSYEGIIERGSDGTNGIQAWGQTGGAGYRFNKLLFKPRIFSQYDYASGDRNSADGIHGTFDTMYPTAHDRFGIADLFGWQNIKSDRAGFTLEPRRRWTVTAQYLDFWLASATDSLYNTSGSSIVRDATGKSGNHIGDEFDVYTWFELNRHVNLGVGVGHLLPGGFLVDTTKGPTYNYPYFAINFKDDGKSRNQ
jgi:hypothetical protein